MGYDLKNERSNEFALMTDIESLGVNPEAPVISIGAVLFDPRARNSFASLRERAFYASVKLDDAVDICGHVDGGTILWWMQQDDAAIKRLVNGTQQHLGEALHGFAQYSHSRHEKQPEWLRSAAIPQTIWAKDPDFDCVILRSAFAKTGKIFPFHFSQTRSVRTIQQLAFPDGDLPKLHEGVAHDACDDAVAQAMMVQVCYSQLGLAYENLKWDRDYT